MATGCVVVMAALTLGHSQAEAEEAPAVVVQEATEACPDRFSEDFLEELKLRTSAELIWEEQPDDEAAGLTMATLNERACELRLEESDESSALVVPADADRLEIASAATRLAWMIDGHDGPAPEPIDEPTGNDDAPGWQEATVAARDAGDTGRRVAEVADGWSVSPAGPSRLGISTDLIGGALWLPAAGGGLPTTRLAVGWQAGSNVELEVSGRLPMIAIEARQSGLDYRYRPWAVDATAGWTGSVGDEWSLGVDAGLRRTFSALSTSGEFTGEQQTDEDGTGGDQTDGTGNREEADRAEDDRAVTDTDPRVEPPDEQDDGRVTGDPETTVRDALSAWSVVVGGSVHYSVIGRLSIGLEAGLGVSPTERKVRGPGGVVMDLGRYEFETLLGLKLRL